MLLNYFKGQNFGDALNPIIFDALLPGFFDDDPSIEFSAIGSIIGLPMSPLAKKRIIFSSGFAYGSLPTIDDTFDIVCVRGPLTAQILNINNTLAITDGAILLHHARNRAASEKKYQYSFMPHWESELKYQWSNICREADIHYISPTLPPEQVIAEIQQSHCIIAEAMHAAIVADTLRIPWLPVKAYQGINEFKWKDWTSSMDLNYAPCKIRSMYSSNDFMVKVFNEKSPVHLPAPVIKTGMKGYEIMQNTFIKKNVIEEFKALKNQSFQLSADATFTSRLDQMLNKLYETKERYSANRGG